jgi:hypothetical protein
MNAPTSTDPRIQEAKGFESWASKQTTANLRNALSRRLPHDRDQAHQVARNTMNVIAQLKNDWGQERVVLELIEQLTTQGHLVNASSSVDAQSEALIDMFVKHPYMREESQARYETLYMVLRHLQDDQALERVKDLLPTMLSAQELGSAFALATATEALNTSHFLLPHYSDEFEKNGRIQRIDFGKLTGDHSSSSRIAWLFRDEIARSAVFEGDDRLDILLDKTMIRMETSDAMPWHLLHAMNSDPGTAQRQMSALNAILDYDTREGTLRDRMHALEINEQTIGENARSMMLFADRDPVAKNLLHMCIAPHAVVLEYAKQLKKLDVVSHRLNKRKTGTATIEPLSYLLVNAATNLHLEWKESLTTLREQGLKFRKPAKGGTVLHEIAEIASTPKQHHQYDPNKLIAVMTCLMIDHGLDPNQKDDRGYTPMSYLGKSKDAKSHWAMVLKSIEARKMALTTLELMAEEQTQSRAKP